MTANGELAVLRRGWQFTGSEVLDGVYVLFFGALSAAWDHAMVARWSVKPVGMLWREMNARFVTLGGGMGSTGRSAASVGHHRRRVEGGGYPPC